MQGHALGEQFIDEPEDLLMPDYQGMEKYQDIINLFQQAVDLECQDAPTKARRGKKSRIEEEDIEEDVKPVKRGRGRGRGRG